MQAGGDARGNINRNAVCTPPAFHPKALRLWISTWQVFWLVSCLLPSHPALGGTVAKCNPFPTAHGSRDETHSYGDSAGFTPDFPFNPFRLSRDRGPDDANVMESWKRNRRILFFHFLVEIDADA
jgi:hypothetical protein